MPERSKSWKYPGCTRPLWPRSTFGRFLSIHYRNDGVPPRFRTEPSVEHAEININPDPLYDLPLYSPAQFRQRRQRYLHLRAHREIRAAIISSSGTRRLAMIPASFISR
jgi:hypothetical protein